MRLSRSSEQRRPDLTVSQLCDLLNFVFRLPRKTKLGKVFEDRISPCVVDSWETKYQRPRVEHWCDAVLVHLAIIEGRPSRSGRRTSLFPPQPVQRWAAKFGVIGEERHG